MNILDLYNQILNESSEQWFKLIFEQNIIRYEKLHYFFLSYNSNITYKIIQDNPYKP
jgi:hypothetical protein